MRAKPGVTVAVLDYTVLVVALAATCVQLFKALGFALAEASGNPEILAAAAAAVMFAAAVCAFGSEIARSTAARAELPLRVAVVLSSLGAVGLVAWTYDLGPDLEVDRGFRTFDLGLAAFTAMVALVAFGLSRRRPRPSPA